MPKGYKLPEGGLWRSPIVALVWRDTLLSIPTPADIMAAAKAKGLTIKQLCAKAGISDETFFRWRRGEHSIGTDKLQRLLDALKSV